MFLLSEITTLIGGVVSTRSPATTTRRTTTTTVRTTRKSTTTTVPSTTSLRTIVSTTTEMTTDEDEMYDVIYDNLDVDSDEYDDGEAAVMSNSEDCWRQKIAEPRSRSGVFTFRGASIKTRCDMDTDGGGWTVREQAPRGHGSSQALSQAIGSFESIL